MNLKPLLHDGIYAFCELPHGAAVPKTTLASFRETESLTVVMTAKEAARLGYTPTFEAAWITISAETSLTDLGITAKFSAALAENGISCNVFAAINHDHIFVPIKDGMSALKILDRIV